MPEIVRHPWFEKDMQAAVTRYVALVPNSRLQWADWLKADAPSGRLFAANEALALGLGGMTATAQATGLARSTINCGIRELRSAGNESGRRVCGDDVPPLLAGIGQDIAHEMHLAALPACVQDFGNRCFQTFMRVRDHQFGAAQAA